MITLDKLNKKEEIKLLDFGETVTLPSTDSNILELCYTGSPLYMAPEIRALDPETYESAFLDGARADLYCLGIAILALIQPQAKN